MENIETVKSFFQSIGLQSWVVQIFIIVFLTLLIAYIQRRLLRRLLARLEDTKTLWDDALVTALQRPLTFLIWIIGISFAIQVIQSQAEAAIFGAVGPLRDVGVITAIAWFLVRFIKYAEINLVAEREKRGNEVDQTTVDSIAKLLRLTVVITAALVVLQTLGFSVSGVLAFGGIGGIAIGFAAKDLLANFFGGLMIYLDRPFAVGDWIRSPDRDIEGTVEEIGWRLTRIRTFDSRPLYVPNSAFTSIAVENPSRMQNRRIYETVGVRYDDADKVAAIVQDVTRMLKTHPEIDTNKTLMVNFNQCAASSLDFFVYCFTKTTVWAEYHPVKEDVLLKILDIVAAHGAEVAFPTSTIHVPDGIGGVGKEESKARIEASRATG